MTVRAGKFTGQRLTRRVEESPRFFTQDGESKRKINLSRQYDRLTTTGDAERGDRSVTVRERQTGDNARCCMKMR